MTGALPYIHPGQTPDQCTTGGSIGCVTNTKDIKSAQSVSGACGACAGLGTPLDPLQHQLAHPRHPPAGHPVPEGGIQPACSPTKHPPAQTATQRHLRRTPPPSPADRLPAKALTGSRQCPSGHCGRRPHPSTPGSPSPLRAALSTQWHRVCGVDSPRRRTEPSSHRDPATNLAARSGPNRTRRL